MLHNFLKITLRNLFRNKSRSLINIGGLTIGLVCTLIIFLAIQHETGYDTHHPDSDRLYRLVKEDTSFDNASYDTGVPYPLPSALRNDFPEIASLSIIDANFASDAVISTGPEHRLKEDQTAFVEPDYFEMFQYEWISGQSSTALDRPNTAVITRSLARRLFEDADPIGKTVTFQVGFKYDLEITGVIQDPPEKTDLPFTLLASYSSTDQQGYARGGDDWESQASSVQCYFKLKEGVAPELMEGRLDDFVAKYRNEEVAANVNYFLQPLSEIHHDTRFGNYSGKVIAVSTLGALGLIGLFLLVTACINFVNLNTAIAVSRSKEVGVRKALGGTRPQLAIQFLGETALTTAVSFLAALTLIELTAGYMQPLLGYEPELALTSNFHLSVFMVVSFIITTLAAGFYPALYLSGFNSIDAIRNRISSGYGKGLGLRRSLVVLQFTVSQVLIICTITMSSQMSYFQNADMGFTDEAVVEVDIPVRDENKLDLFKNQLSEHAAILSFSFSNTGAAHGSTWGGNYVLELEDEIREGNGQVKYIEPEYLDTYKIELIAGSNITPTDTVTQYLVNETFARDAGFENRYHELLGKPVQMWGFEAPIVGVVRDFNSNSLHRTIQPVLLASRNLYYLAGMNVESSRIPEALEVIEQAYEAAFPEYVFSYLFLDDRIENFYRKEQQIARVMQVFTLIAILIGALGLFGLVSHMAVTREKEVGIRKILGATVGNILMMFSREFLLLIGLSFLISAPIAWVLMNQWLSDFAYQIDLGPQLFALAFAATLLLSLVTVGYKSIRTAGRNPAVTLKSE